LVAVMAMWIMSTMLVRLRPRLLGTRMAIHMCGARRR
jgi:hypothetical protein